MRFLFAPVQLNKNSSLLMGEQQDRPQLPVCEAFCPFGKINYLHYNTWHLTTFTLRLRVREETFTYSHLSWSSIILYLLPPSTTIHSILPVQFTCLTVYLHNLSPSPLWSATRSGTLHFVLHTFLHPVIVFFSQQMPIPMQPVLLKYRDYVIYS